MFYEEAVVNGVLCSRSTPDGKFQAFTLEAMTIAYTSMKSEMKSERFARVSAEGRVKSAIAILSN